MTIEQMVQIFREEFIHGLADYEDTDQLAQSKEHFVERTMNKALVRILMMKKHEEESIPHEHMDDLQDARAAFKPLDVTQG